MLIQEEFSFPLNAINCSARSLVGQVHKGEKNDGSAKQQKQGDAYKQGLDWHSHVLSILVAVVDGGGALQNPCAATSSAELNLLERFWNAISAVSSMTASSLKWLFRRAIRPASTWRSVWVIAAA